MAQRMSIVPQFEYDPGMTLSSTGDVFLGGQIGPLQESVPEEPRRPIGFRIPLRDPEIADPSWMLI